MKLKSSNMGNKARPLISVVSPEYMGAGMVSELVQRNITALSAITDNFEIILVNDASPDNAWEMICLECEKDKRVKGINLSRNFGQHYAITAGLAYAKGEWIVVMDCDLQDRPEEIPNLYKKALEGFEIVYAKRTHKQFSAWKKIASTLHHNLLNWLSGAKTDSSISNFGIYKQIVVNEYNKMPEHARAFHYLIEYLGFKNTAIDVQHATRVEGRSSYSLRKLFKLSLDIIISNSNKPLRIAVTVGLVMSAFSIILAIYNLLAKCFGIIQVAGYTTTVFSIWCVGGLLLLVMGILGLYIGKIYDQVKGRQIFIIRDKINLDL